MAQQKIKIDGVEIFQPDSGLTWEFETTYTSASTRPQSGVGRFAPMFTVESYQYKASNVPVADVAQILQLVTGRNFSLYHFSPYTGRWETGTFYVGKGTLVLGLLKEDEEIYNSVTFNMIGVNPIC